MISQLDTNQQFVFDQIKYGLANKPSPEPLTDVDVERLSWPADAYSKIPSQDWNEWSRKIHWALQYAFSHDTSRLENKERLEVWRKKCMAVVRSALAKGENGQTVLESSAFHFVQQDLLHHLVDVFGVENLTEEERGMVSVLYGATKQENIVQRQKAAEIIGYSRRRAKAIGCMIWPIMLVAGFAGFYLWKWYALPISLIVGVLFGNIYSKIETMRIQQITGLTIHEQKIAYRESFAASLDPITRDPEQYRSYINSLPEDGSGEK